MALHFDKDTMHIRFAGDISLDETNRDPVRIVITERGQETTLTVAGLKACFQCLRWVTAGGRFSVDLYGTMRPAPVGL